MAGQPTPANAGFADFGDYAGTEDILSEIFGRQGRGAPQARRMLVIISSFLF